MKMNINIDSLAKHQDRYDELISLIHETFQYSESFKFNIDFLPLVHPSNWKNCFLIFNEKELIGHIGFCNKKFLYKNIIIDCAFIGGVCIKEQYQGKGIFKNSMNIILEKIKNVSLVFLWSGHDKGYQQFNFYESGKIFQTGTMTFEPLANFSHSKLSELTQEEKSCIINAYNTTTKKFITPMRSLHDWEIIFSMSSIEVYFKKYPDKKFSYFFINKGQDLFNIIHEYGSNDLESEKELIENIQKYKLWSPIPVNSNHTNVFYLANIRIHNKNLLKAWANELGFDIDFDLSEKEIIDQIFNSQEFIFYIPGCDSI